MRFTALSVLFGLLGLCITVASPQQTSGNLDLANLSTCARTCLEQTQCQPGQSCFCNNGAVSTAIESCLRVSCPVEDQLAAKKYEANTCGLPVRSQSSTSPVVWTLFALACFFALLRFINRCPQAGGIGYWWDDCTLWFTCLPMIALTVVGYLARQHGIGKDVWESSVSDIVVALRLFWIGEPLYILTVYGTKVSFLLLYLRVWKDDSTFRLLCWSLIGIVAAAFVAFEFATIFQCIPVHYNWTGFVGGQGTCDNQEAQAYTNAAFNILFDVVILLLPVRALLGLQLTTHKKIGLCLIYLVGWAVVVCACVRMRYLVKFGEVGASNVTWYYNYIGLWSTVEALLGVICVCLPNSVGVTIRTFKKVQHHRDSRHITECDEKSLTERPPTRTLRTSAYVNNSSIVLDEESAVGKEVLEPQLSSSSNTSDAQPRGSDSSVDLEQIANTLAFQDRTMPAVEEQRRKEAAKKVVTQLLRNLEKKHPSRTELSRPSTREARRSAESEHHDPSISSLDEAVEPEDEGGDIILGHKKSMLPCEDPPPLTEELLEQQAKERASASSGVEPTTIHHTKRPSMDSRRLSSRSAQSESAAGSVHAFYDNVNAEPFFTDISPEEAKHRADLQEFRAWRTILPSEIPLRDEDVGRTSRDVRRAMSTRSRTRSSRGLRRTQSMVRTRSSPSRTRASSCESSGDVLDPPLNHRSQRTSVLYAEVQALYNQHQARSRSPPREQQSTESFEQSATHEPSADLVEPPEPFEAEHRNSEPEPSADFQQYATFAPSADFPEPPSAFEAEHRVSDPSITGGYPSITAQSSWQQRNSRSTPLRYGRGPPPRNSDGSTNTDDSYHGQGVSLSFEGEQRISEANTPADELNDPYHSHNKYGSERSLYEPRQVYRRSDGSSSSAASNTHPLRSQGMSDIYSHKNSSSKRTSYFAPQRHHSYQSFQSAAKGSNSNITNVGGIASPFGASPGSDSSPSPVISPPEDSDSVSPPPIRRHRSTSEPYAAEYASSMESIPRTSDDESTVRPSTAITYRQEWPDSPTSQRPPSTMSMINPSAAAEAAVKSEENVATNDFALSFPSPSESEIHREEEEERLRRRHAAETVFNLVVESRDAKNKLPEEFSSSNSSLESSSSNDKSGSGSGRPRHATRSMTAAPASSQLSNMMDFHTKSKMFDEEVKKLKQRQMRGRSYEMEKKDAGKVKVDEESWYFDGQGQKVLSPHPKASPPSVSKLNLGDGRKLVIGREQIDLCAE